MKLQFGTVKIGKLNQTFVVNFKLILKQKKYPQLIILAQLKKAFKKITEEIAEDLRINPDKYKKIKNSLVDISNTEEYAELLHSKEVAIRKIEIERELLDLDSKRVRAMCEPSVRNEESGETWLDYYNKQVALLRDEYNNL